MPTRVIGIDPGLTGALAMIGPDGLEAVADIPTCVKGTIAKVRNEVNGAGLSQLLREWVNGHADEVLIVIERVSSMPGQGVATMMSLGDTVGCIRGVVQARGYPLCWTEPQTWKKALRLTAPKCENKNERQRMAKELVRARAVQLYPQAELARKKDHNRAEAILIARYGWEYLR